MQGRGQCECVSDIVYSLIIPYQLDRFCQRGSVEFCIRPSPNNIFKTVIDRRRRRITEN